MPHRDNMLLLDEVIREELEKVRRRLENPAYRIAAAVVPKIMKY